jgi:hypothetical protein
MSTQLDECGVVSETRVAVKRKSVDETVLLLLKILTQIAGTRTDSAVLR